MSNCIDFNPSIISFINHIKDKYLYKHNTEQMKLLIESEIYNFCIKLFLKGYISKEMKDILILDLISTIKG